MDKTRIQLGDNILITGRVYENNELFEEQVNIKFYFTSEGDQNEVYLSIFDGTFSLSPRLRDLGTGNYVISVELVDLDGNTLHYFEDLQSLFVDNKLILDLHLEAEQLNPGESLQIVGLVKRNLDNKEIPLGDVTVELDGMEHSTEVRNGNVDYELILGEDITSGYHDVKLKVDDSFGNVGEIVLSFYAIPQQESLEIILEKKTFFPGDEVYVFAAIYDQANIEMIDDVVFKVYNPKDKKVLDEELSTSSSAIYILPENALPGEWKVRVESEKIETERFFEVLVSETLDIELIAQTLRVRNSGNIKYEETLKVIAFNEEHNETFEFRTGLKPGDNLTIDLYRILKDLDYEITVLNTEEVFNVEIYDDRGFIDKTGDFLKSVTGQAIHSTGSKNGNAASYSFGIIILLVIIFSAFFFNKGPILKKRKKEKPVGKFKTKNGEPKLNKKAQEEAEIEDFKTRILKDIEKAKVKEDKKEDSKPFNVQPFFPLPKEYPKGEKPKRFSFDKPLRKE